MHKYKRLEAIIDDYAKVYCFSYNEGKRRYQMNNDNILFTIDDITDDELCELLSLGYNIMCELGLDVYLSVPPNCNFKDILDYLEVVYEEKEDYSLFINGDNKVGTYKDNTLLIDINMLLNEISNEEEKVEVSIIAQTKEEKFKAQILMQDLRLSGVITALNKDDTPHSIIIKASQLSKGLVIIKDNLTGEVSDVPEDEVLEYVLGII